MSKHFKTILAVRFAGYFVFFIGLTSFIFMLGPLIQVEVEYRIDRLIGVKRTVATTPGESPSTSLGTSKPISEVSQEATGSAGFGTVAASEDNIVPVSTEYGIVIEKINANAKVIAGVNPANEKEYGKALASGVAEALGSTPPGQPGNLYLFSHSTDAPWNIVRFNAIFYLLRELEPGDRVIIFYKNKRYDYIVFDKTIAKPSDVSFLTNKYDYPVLTMQTCDPPGTVINRLIIRAKMVQ